ncbi:MAG TPA: hypothetical protein DDY77_02080, partial [Clostridiales bacterium]|nr:hypothetical protein [Clostridiales bacterium]
QLAESVNKELFIYVYQPSGESKNFKASSINISTTINDSISYSNYKLDFLNSDGVFYKYKVAEFTVRNENVRYYAISSIFRPFDESIDEQASGGNTITEVNYAVNKQYAFGTINGKPYVNCVDIETIVVTDKFVGFVRYENGFTLYNSACDSHFVAFNTNKPIDKLLEADVYYTAQAYGCSWAAITGDVEKFGEKEDKYAHLEYTDKVEHTGEGWFAGTYKWDRIQTIDDFINGENRENIFYGAVLNVKVATKLTNSALSELEGKKWVLRFCETGYSANYSTVAGSSSKNFTLVGDVTILRLKFVTDGITYNLGVIDNKQSGSSEPSNSTSVGVELNSKFTDRWKKIFGLLALLLLLVVLLPYLPTIFTFILNVITLPFKAINGLFKAARKRKKEKK